jgi:hypothetical protein
MKHRHPLHRSPVENFVMAEKSRVAAPLRQILVFTLQAAALRDPGLVVLLDAVRQHQ